MCVQYCIETYILFLTLGNPSASIADINESVTDNNILDNNSDSLWSLSQNNPIENTTIITNYSKYGFANKVSGVLIPFEVCIIMFYDIFFVILLNVNLFLILCIKLTYIC